MPCQSNELGFLRLINVTHGPFTSFHLTIIQNLEVRWISWVWSTFKIWISTKKKKKKERESKKTPKWMLLIKVDDINSMDQRIVSSSWIRTKDESFNFRVHIPCSYKERSQSVWLQGHQVSKMGRGSGLFYLRWCLTIL